MGKGEKEAEEILGKLEKAAEGTDGKAAAWLHLLRAKALAGLGRWDRALWAFGEVLERDPAHLEARRGRAMAFARLGEWGKALLDLEETLKLSPGDWKLKALQGIARLETKDPEGALASLEEALEAEEDPLLLAVAARAHLELGRTQQAEALASKALEKNPQLILARLIRGLVHLVEGRPSKAFEELEAIQASQLEEGRNEIEEFLERFGQVPKRKRFGREN
ncbi:MAG: tetratricopeptide repeat protein [Thermus sp.]